MIVLVCAQLTSVLNIASGPSRLNGMASAFAQLMALYILPVLVVVPQYNIGLMYLLSEEWAYLPLLTTTPRLI